MSTEVVNPSRPRLIVAGDDNSEYVAVEGEDKDVDGAAWEIRGVGKVYG